jgi:hypothetical protein
MSDTRQQLMQAYQYIKEGNATKAENLLIEILQKNEDNADAWWLMANAVGAPDEQRESLEQVLRIRPGDEKASKMLEKINRLHPPKAAAVPVDDDPFADLGEVAAPKQNINLMANAKVIEDDPFGSNGGDDDDPFAELAPKPSAAKKPLRTFTDADVPAKRTATPEKKRTSPWLIAALIIGVVALIGCGACLFITAQGASIFGAAFNDVLLTITADPDAFATIVAVSGNNSSSGGSSFQGSTNARGNIESGQSLIANVDTFTDDSWTFTAEAGTRYEIQVNAREDGLDPQLYVYGVDNQLVVENDDIDGLSNTNSLASFTASSSGRHTIVISAFGSGGSYEVILRRN